MQEDPILPDSIQHIASSFRSRAQPLSLRVADAAQIRDLDGIKSRSGAAGPVLAALALDDGHVAELDADRSPPDLAALDLVEPAADV